jgi:hypothetical protein
MHPVRKRIRYHARERRRIQKDDWQAVRTATTSTESPPGPEKEEVATDCKTARPQKHSTLTNYIYRSILTGKLQAGSDLPPLTSQLVFVSQLAQMAAMPAIGKNAVVNELLAVIRCSYYLPDKIMGPKLPLLSSLHILITKVTKKKRGAGASPTSDAWGWTPLFRILGL